MSDLHEAFISIKIKELEEENETLRGEIKKQKENIECIFTCLDFWKKETEKLQSRLDQVKLVMTVEKCDMV